MQTLGVLFALGNGIWNKEKIENVYCTGCYINMSPKCILAYRGHETLRRV